VSLAFELGAVIYHSLLCSQYKNCVLLFTGYFLKAGTFNREIGDISVNTSYLGVMLTVTEEVLHFTTTVDLSCSFNKCVDEILKCDH